MRCSKPFRLALMGIVVHLVLIKAVFDIYFASPIYHGMPAYKTKGAAPAKRVVIVVMDGLRAQSLYSLNMRTAVPSIWALSNQGLRGIAHTRVPTESRPGHAAILGGIYEDPSAIVQGWQQNPVEFDSVINQSTNAWCWGSPDIVNLFNKEQLPHITSFAYDYTLQDFSGKSAPEKLDEWVFQEVLEFFKIRKDTPCNELCAEGNVFFLHLLGLDTAGHIIKPTSEKYLDNIKIVDRGIGKIYNVFNSFYKDDRTTYILTADHGMTNWGSHGSGTEHETQVPFLAWGAGIVRTYNTIQLNQIDIAPLISSLIGSNIPINSMGLVPVKVLNTTAATKANMLLANVRQLGEQYMKKHKTVKATTIPILFKPFSELPDEAAVQKKIDDVVYHLENINAVTAIPKCSQLADLFHKGMEYYQSYYRFVLLFSVGFGFVGWIFYLFNTISSLDTRNYLRTFQQVFRRYPRVPVKWVACLALTLNVVLYPFVRSLSWKYYVYFMFPIFTWCNALLNYRHGIITMKLIYKLPRLEFWLLFAYYFMGIELLILGFTYKFCLFSLCIVLVALEVITLKIFDKVWIAGLVTLGVSSAIIQRQTEFSYIIHLVSFLCWMGYLYADITTFNLTKERETLKYCLAVLTVAFLNGVLTQITITLGWGLTFISQFVAWCSIPVAVLLPLSFTTRICVRTVSIIIGLVSIYVQMAIGLESMYLMFLVAILMQWLKVTHMQVEESRFTNQEMYWITFTRPLVNPFTDKDSVKQSFFFLCFILLSFFGPGNTASMNSFDPLWTRCFVSIFNLLTMTLLVILKLIIPFLLVVTVFYGVVVIQRAKITNNFIIVLIFSDIMVLHFLYFIRTDGSWLEIGASLSQFLVVNVTTMMLLLLYLFASYLTNKKFNSIDLAYRGYKKICALKHHRWFTRRLRRDL